MVTVSDKLSRWANSRISYRIRLVEVLFFWSPALFWSRHYVQKQTKLYMAFGPKQRRTIWAEAAKKEHFEATASTCGPI